MTHQRPRIKPPTRRCTPGDSEVDLIGLDIYNTGPQLDWGAPRWRSFASVLAEPYKAITAISSKPLILPEVGTTGVGGSKADWISDMFQHDLSQFPKIRALVWFDVDKEQAWSLTSGTGVLQAWLAGSADNRFTAGPTTFA